MLYPLSYGGSGCKAVQSLLLCRLPPVVDKRWNYQAPNDGRCNAAH